ncbi:MAG: alanine--tRNA ligase [Candidatus Omnitrophica bacterium]|nr:alanine--tRNA ligase [Candidatus Omnitrophota bacterium]
MTVDQIRKKFLDFFKKRGHAVVASDSLIPKDDPTLLFTGAGMNQFKDQFMGRNITFKRAASSQKCLRTGDLDNVGRTAGHHTFFEMLGNFSFGDYFKKEAIAWAWEFLTKDLRIPEERLWVSVYKEDDEAYDIWKKAIKVPAERIVKFGDKDNFWPSEVKEHGPNGPCGPCSEIFFDWGTDAGCGEKGCDPSCGCDRFVEVWNLVFTQFERREGGILKPLPTKNIDTGMGLERLAAVLQNKKTNFGTDLFAHIIKVITKEIGVHYGKDVQTDSHINAIADHIRALAFAIFDGARPSNEGRGFVMRKLVRKSSQRARALGVHEPFMYKLIPVVANVMKGAYPELVRRREDIAEVILSEEISLKEMIDTHLPHVEEEFIKIRQERKNMVPGAVIFRFYDEKGIPLDLIEEKASSAGLKLDTEGFGRLLEEQKNRSRDKSKVSGSIFFEKLSDVDLKTEFLYDIVEAEAKVRGILRESAGKTERVKSATAGEIIHIALDRTTFYGESGGQAGDRGQISGKGFNMCIDDAKKYEDTIDHIGKVLKGTVSVGDTVEVKIDVKRREKIKANHTATHLLQSALKKVLGDHVQQYGSLVEEDRLRFDFTHTLKPKDSQLERIEDLVNENIKKNVTVTTKEMDVSEAKRSGAIALFGEKYKERVLVRSIGDISKELCGGTHVKKTGEIDIFKVLSESSIASGVRRIEALTKDAVCSWARADIKMLLGDYREALKGIKKSAPQESGMVGKIEEYLRPIIFRSEAVGKKRVEDFGRDDLNAWLKELKPEIVRTVEDLSKEAKKMKKVAKSTKLNDLRKELEIFIKEAKDIDGIRVISREIEGADMGILRPLIDNIKKSIGSGVILLGARGDARVDLVCGVTEDLIKKGIDASGLIKRIALIVGGSGGGRPDMAQAGGKDPARLKDALDGIFKILKEEYKR